MILALLWDMIEGLAIVIRAHHRGLHPGSVVAMDLIAWLALVGGNAGLGYIGMATDLNDTLRYPLSAYHRQGTISPDLRDDVQEVARMGVVVIALLTILTCVVSSSTLREKKTARG